MNSTHEKFNDVKSIPLQSYNRLIVFNNILVDMGEEQARSYLNQFSDNDVKKVVSMGVFLAQNGPKKTLDFVKKHTVFEEDKYEAAA